uniref:Uncharacterized protein n=1 Tax=Vespula pensylvanica TaxID=30213 RepID=A0A834KHF4_VESPE|nr:hypothetical protein H0235_014424 [Vespula pensylvanica]
MTEYKLGSSTLGLSLDGFGPSRKSGQGSGEMISCRKQAGTLMSVGDEKNEKVLTRKSEKWKTQSNVTSRFYLYLS